jgi:hypothetical protein
MCSILLKERSSLWRQLREPRPTIWVISFLASESSIRFMHDSRFSMSFMPEVDEGGVV